MPRIRTIKPEAFTSETMADLPIPARWLFAGLWTYCDDEGRGVDNPRLIKAAIYPLDDDVTADMVDEYLTLLAKGGFIYRYADGGRRFLVCPNFRAHQSINKPSRSKLPPPPDGGGQESLFGDSDLPGAHAHLNGSSGRADAQMEPSRMRTVRIPGGKEQGTGNRESNAHAHAQDGTDAHPSFDEFWDVYPKRVDKRRAEQAWAAALKRGADPAEVLAAAERYADQRAGQDSTYTKYPATWLNGNPWDDEDAGPSRPRPRGEAYR